MTTRDQLLDQLRQHLIALPDQYALLGLFALPGSRPADPDARIGTSSPARPPVVLDVLDLTDERTKADTDHTRTDYDLDRRAGARRQGILPTLGQWVRLVDGELWDEALEHQPPADTSTVATECGFLLTHLAWIREQQWVTELADDVDSISRDVRRALGDRDQQVLRCPDCAWYVEERDKQTWAVCTGCGRTWTYASELDRLNREQGTPRSATYLADQLGVTPRAIRRWKDLGLIKVIGRHGAADLYDEVAVRRVAARGATSSA